MDNMIIASVTDDSIEVTKTITVKHNLQDLLNRKESLQAEIDEIDSIIGESQTFKANERAVESSAT
jgi:hypothetical protein